MISLFDADSYAITCHFLIQFDIQGLSTRVLSEISPYIVIFTIPLASHVAPVAGKLLLRYPPAVRLVQVKRPATVNALVGIVRISHLILIFVPKHVEIPLYLVGGVVYQSPRLSI